MKIRRVNSLIQGIADVRSWVLEHIPEADTMLGYDLFLRCASSFLSDKHPEVAQLARELPYSAAEVGAHLQRMQQAGLIAEVPCPADPAVLQLYPTADFVQLLDAYSNKFESLFILRKGLRDRQLVVDTADPDLQHFAESLYDHLYDLGWLYLHNFGATCFLMAMLVQRVAESYGHRARLLSGYARISNPQGYFMLGGPGMAKPGQIDGHALCLIDDKLLVDFGVGSARKFYRRDFPWALVCDYRPHDGVLGAVALPGGEIVSWRDDWQFAGSDAEFHRYEEHVEALFLQYKSYYG
ncbi:MAG: helix-turn-helix domain-containing protein [Pseudomonadota bacterium]